jgi:hypothetical protein
MCRYLFLSAVLAFLGNPVPGQSRALQVPVFVTLPEGAPETVEGRIVVRQLVAGKGVVEDVLPLPLPARFDYGTVPGRVVEVWVEAPGYWSPRRLVVGRVAAEPVRIPLFATGVLRGKVTVPAGEDLPTLLMARFQPIHGGEAVAGVPLEGRVECPISPVGEVLCALPAGTLDVRLRAEGFVSHFLWGMPVKAGETRLVGLVPLERGGSVVAWIEAEDTGEGAAVALEEVRARLERVQAGGASAQRERQRLARTMLENPVSERGFVHFRGVAPGQYRLVVEKEGFGETYSPPVTVYENVETALRAPVVLRPEARLDLQLIPPRDPHNRPWWVELYAAELASGAGGAAESRGQGEASEEGLWSRGGLPLGGYNVMVQASDGSRWGFETVSVDRPRVRREVEIGMVVLDGTVTLGGEPLPAAVYFGGRRGVRSVRFQADAHGVFSGALPTRGGSASGDVEEWVVDVVAEEPKVERRLVGITLERGEGATATVALELDDLRLLGELVDEEGNPVAGMVFLQSRESGRPEQRQLGEEGTFEYRGLRAGNYGLQGYARGGMATSEQQEVELEAGTPAPFVRLELAPPQVVVGQVLSTGGPVPGARILAEARREGRTAAMVTLPQQTDVTGRFQMTVPAGSDEVILTVAAPGFGLRMHSAEPAGPVTVPVYREAGTLQLRFPGEGDPWTALGRAILRQNGVAIPATALKRWVRVQGGGPAATGDLVLPHLEFGQYELCPRNTQEGRGTCAGGFLSPGGELLLTLP